MWYSNNYSPDLKWHCTGGWEWAVPTGHHHNCSLQSNTKWQSLHQGPQDFAWLFNPFYVHFGEGILKSARCICFTTDSAIGNTYLRNTVSSNIPHSFITSCKHARHEYFIKRQLGRNGITIGKFRDTPIDRSKELYAIEMMRVAAELPWLCCKP